MGVTITW